MLVFARENCRYVYIHIPKNGGKYTRKCILDNPENTIIHSYWGVKAGVDLAHIPYMKIGQYIDDIHKIRFFAHSRNPYDRIISAYFYRNRNCTLLNFKNFVKYDLHKTVFSMEFPNTLVHYYPQYLFICDESMNIYPGIEITELDTCQKYDLRVYFDDECLASINSIYKRDFELFGYPMIHNMVDIPTTTVG